jgi:hypothetical protein
MWGLAPTHQKQVKSCGQRSDLSTPSTRCFRRFEEIAFEGSVNSFRSREAKSARIHHYKGSTALLQREGFAINAEMLFTLFFTVENLCIQGSISSQPSVERIFAFKAEYLFTLVTVERILQSKQNTSSQSSQ